MKRLVDFLLTPSAPSRLSPSDLAETLRWKSTLDRQWSYEWRDLDIIDPEPTREQHSV
jgi:hypothetical protein